MNSYRFTTDVDGERVSQVEDALVYVKRRLLGRVPRVLVELCTQLTGAFWDGAAASGDATRIAGVTGKRLSSTSAVDDRTPEQVAEDEAAAAELAAWNASPQGVRENAFGDFLEARRGETELAYRAWLEEQADAFTRARAQWRLTRRDQLRSEFAATAGEFTGRE